MLITIFIHELNLSEEKSFISKQRKFGICHFYLLPIQPVWVYIYKFQTFNMTQIRSNFTVLDTWVFQKQKV